DGAAWTTTIETGSHDLAAVWTESPTEAWAASSYGALVHWDGQRWSAVTSGTNLPLAAMFGAAGSVWTVGGTGTILEHRRGRARPLSPGRRRPGPSGQR